MKAWTIWWLVIFLVGGAAAIFGQAKDLSGTWIGETAVPNSPDKDIVTLVLKKTGDSYTGTISDSLGMLNTTPLEKVKLENDVLSFEVVVLVSTRNIRVRTTLKISSEKLAGSWEAEDGSSGLLEMVRAK